MLQATLLPLLALAVGGANAAAAAKSPYDYIVVGSGPGGGPLAANLARAGFPTLLIEAGDDQGDNPTYSEIQNFIAASNDPLTRWDFFVKHSSDPAREAQFEHRTWRLTNGSFYVGTEPPAGAVALGIWYPRAATLGGCAMHNGAVATLPADADWDLVANKTGDKSWLASNMRNYFIKLENNTYLPRGTPGHGFDGWLQISEGYGAVTGTSTDGYVIDEQLTIASGQEVSATLANTKRDVNLLDPKRDDGLGLFEMVGHITPQGLRSSPNTYIKATLNDPKKYPLTLKLNTFVTKVLFDSNSKKPTAIGVEALQGASVYSADPKKTNTTTGTKVQFFANREVIVAGGAFNTPQILKHSGIGPAAELKKFGIPLVKDLPGVGEKLADNYEGSIISFANRNLSETDGQVTLFMHTPTAPTAERNIQAFCGQFSFEGFWPGYPTSFGDNEYECALVHMKPKSQAGYVRLLSADPLDMPEINFNFFENNADADLTEMLDGMKLVRKALNSVAPDSGMLPWDELHPCPGVNQNCTDEAQKEFIKTQAYSHHATSTAAIGADDDPLAVLDSEFRVRGVANLRVVDASAFPVVPGAFPIIPTAMLSEKASDVIITAAKNHH